MQVTALAEALMSVRSSDGAVSLHDLQIRLLRAGLEEFARAVASLRQRARVQKDEPHAGPRPWL